MTLKVGDRVKVIDCEEMRKRNLADRYGHIESMTSGDFQMASVSFNDFTQAIETVYLKYVSPPSD